MPTDKTTYSTRLSKEEADRLENYRERHDLTKSDALRELAGEGLRADERRRSYFERSLVLMISIGLAATLTLLISTALIVFAGTVGIAVGVSPWQVLAAAAITVLVSAAGFIAEQFRLGERADGVVNRAGRRIANWIRGSDGGGA
ncbi:MAG: hypothetical protein ACOCUA_02595 [archaeon]